ncbi:MAG TPA: hypothetical protein VHZ76_07230 [Gammaproteobacteria bacterium]|nr:hypothetical protein [Gammaproteobacteria bacterium]
MNIELIELKQELIIQKQQNEILELKYKLHKTHAEKASRLEDSLLSPQLYEHYQKVAVMLSTSGVIPNAYKGKSEDIFVAMAMGYQLGFPVEQSLQDIAVINGRPCLWGDGLLSLALNHPECQSINEEPIINDQGNVIGYRCTVIRRGHAPHIKQFTLQDASLAGLLSRGTVWKAYPERMLQMRARSYAIRDKFADALRGLRIVEIEEEDSRVIEAEVEVTVEGNTQVDKLKSILKERNNDKGHSDSSISDNVLNITEYSNGTTLSGINDSGRQSDLRISSEQLDKINELLEIKRFSAERIKKALIYCKVESFEDLYCQQAESFILELERS